jgi:hypothetical protein
VTPTMDTSEIAVRGERFLSEQSVAWADILSLLETLGDAFAQCQKTIPMGESFSEGIRHFSEASHQLYLDAYAQYERRRPSRRALSALEELDSVLGIDMALRRAAIDGKMQLLLARAALRLRDPWITYRNLRQKQVKDKDAPASQSAERSDWIAALERDKRTVQQVMDRYQTWLSKAAAKPSDAKSSRNKRKAYQNNLSFWWQRQRAITASLESESRVIQMTRESLEITSRKMDALRVECEEVRRALRNRIDYLNHWSGGTYEPPDSTTFGDCLEILRKHRLVERVTPAVRQRLESGAAGQIEETPKENDPAFRNKEAVIAGNNAQA